MSNQPAVAVALTFVWLGMVLAVSFLETPLTFQAPNVTLQIGLGISRLVFRVLNTIEVGLALVIFSFVMSSPPCAGAVAALLLAFTVLAAQLMVVRPWLTNRADKVLATQSAPRSHGYYVYAGFEMM